MKATVVFQKNWDAIHAVTETGERRYRYIINTGTSRSSKTGSIIQCFELWARQNPNKRLTAWRDTKKDCKDTVLHDALRYLKMWGTYLVDQVFNKTESIFTYTNSSTFEIHGTDDEEKVMGLNKAVAWLNEPYKISRETFDQIDQRTDDFIIIDWNPKKNHWIDDIAKDPRAIVIHSTFHHNPFCPPEQRRKILSYQPLKMATVVLDKRIKEQDAYTYDTAANPLGFSKKEVRELARCQENHAKNSANLFNWQVYGLGVKGERPHRIFRWEPVSPDAYRQLDTKEYIGVDWGAVDPWGILGAKYYDGALYFRQLNYTCENDIRARLSATELSQIAGKDEGLVSLMFKRLGIEKTTEIICDNNRPTKVTALRAGGWSQTYLAAKIPGSIIDGISALSDMKCYYTTDSPDLEYEQDNYSRKLDPYGKPLEEPEDENNHLMDPARYIYFHLVRKGVIRRK